MSAIPSPSFDDLNRVMLWADVHSISVSPSFSLDVFAIERVCRVLGRRKMFIQAFVRSLTTTSSSVLRLEEINQRLKNPQEELKGHLCQWWDQGLGPLAGDYKYICEKARFQGRSTVCVPEVDFPSRSRIALNHLQKVGAIRYNPEERGWEPTVLLHILEIWTGKRG